MSHALFDFAAERLEQHSSLDRLEARGTLRIALKIVGLDLATLSGEQLAVVFEQVLPGELEKRGVEGAASICRTVLKEVASAPEAAAADRIEDAEKIFRRLGRD
ncbi:MAG: hypothetical protein OEM49_08090 [Myxococcales bacterium]|nr:hypothetical protein [Myxococcales bacterium]MDH5567822.1 hypothetical protein [Myxococcales bacterium]